MRDSKNLFLACLFCLLSARCTLGEPTLESPLESCSIPAIEGEVRCGIYEVFEDRARKTGRTIGIQVVVLRALEPSGKLDPIVLVAGGPGQAAIDLASVFNRRYAHLRRHRDILLIDQRGTGGSNRLSCDTPLPRGPGSLFGNLFPADHVDNCRQRLESHADLRFYTTPLAADDMDEIREWLGYEKLNLIGGSYGTRFVQVYLRRYNRRVRTAVLNGVVPIHRNIYLHGATNLEQAFERFVEACETDESCSQKYPGFRKQTQELMSRFEKAERIGVLGRGDFAYAIRGLLYSSNTDRLPRMVEDAYETGDLEPFSSYYIDRASWVASSFATGMHLSVVCSEDVGFTRESEVGETTSGTFMGDYLYRQYEGACRRWPKGVVAEDYREPVHSSAPVLLLSGEWDPVTPPSWGNEVAEHLSNSLHVIVPRAGHGVAGPCISRIENRFITQGNAKNLDTSCALEKRP